jgi:hypothetical protein
MLFTAKLKDKADKVIAEPIRNANILAIFACVLAGIALIMAVVKR